jgi:hypothetical protein
MMLFLSAVFPVLEVIKNTIKNDVLFTGQTDPGRRVVPGPAPWVYITVGAVIVIMIAAAVMVIKRARNIKPNNTEKENK